jgi:2-C-methyl-D-erythritol 4-phosphate cytidylyltransferase
MASPVPKQLLILKGLPVIMHSIKAFYNHNTHTSIVVVFHPDYIGRWTSLCEDYNFSIPHSIVAGGSTRFHSVLNGLQHIWTKEENEDSVIAIHDGVRPLLTKKLIADAFETAFLNGSAVPAVKSADSVRLMSPGGMSSAVDRDKIALVQTPQTFRSSVLRKAYAQPFNPAFTDDASVVEKSGYPIHLVEGDTRNIKVTYPVDLVIADKLIELD